MLPTLNHEEMKMSNANQPFADAVVVYPDFKGLFKRFCDEATKRLNGNDYLPDVSFSADADGASAKLQALDRTFEISFSFLVVKNEHLGVLEVSLPQENKEPVRLFHLSFDRLGDVKPTSDSGFHNIHRYGAEFVQTFVNRVAHEYFSHLCAVFCPGDGSQEWSTR
jgi:hypothetical protein